MCLTPPVRTGELFDLLRDGRPWTRAQLAEATGLARSTITARIDTLMRLGLVAPFGGARSTGGRPPALFALNPTAKLVVGVDIGATHATAALTDLNGSILGETDARIAVADGPEAVLSWVVDSVRDLVAASERPIEDLAAIGIGLPGPVEHSTGRPINPPIMPGWDRFDVPAYLQEQYPVPVLVDNDVNIMALGERRGHLRDVDDLVLIKVATGIGAGIVSGGVLQRGAQGTAGDLGHVRVPGADDVLCRCGNAGCLEAVASAGAIARRYREATGIEPEGAKDVIARAAAGDEIAADIWNSALDALTMSLAQLTAVVAPEAVIIGGGLSRAGGALFDELRTRLAARLSFHRIPVLVPAELSGNAGLLGAALRAREVT